MHHYSFRSIGICLFLALGLSMSSPILAETLGPSYSGPIVAEDRVFVTETEGGKTEFVRALDRTSGEELWRASWPGEGSVPPFARANGLGNGRLTCLDLKTGETRWTSTPFGEYWPMAVRGDKILALDERGELVLIRANPDKLEVLGTRKVSDAEAWAHLAVSGEEVFVRDLGSVTAYRWRKSP